MPKNKAIYSLPYTGASPKYMESLEGMHYDFWHYRHYIHSGRSSKHIQRYLSAIHNYKVTFQVPSEIESSLKTLKKKVRALCVYDYTRSQLEDDIGEMLVLLTKALLHENPAWEIPANYTYWPEYPKQ